MKPKIKIIDNKNMKENEFGFIDNETLNRIEDQIESEFDDYMRDHFYRNKGE